MTISKEESFIIANKAYEKVHELHSKEFILSKEEKLCNEKVGQEWINKKIASKHAGIVRIIARELMSLHKYINLILSP